MIPSSEMVKVRLVGIYASRMVAERFVRSFGLAVSVQENRVTLHTIARQNV